MYRTMEYHCLVGHYSWLLVNALIFDVRRTEDDKREGKFWNSMFN